MITICYVKIFTIAKSISKRDDVSIKGQRNGNWSNYILHLLIEWWWIGGIYFSIIVEKSWMTHNFLMWHLILIETRLHYNLRQGIMVQIYFIYSSDFDNSRSQALVKALESSSQRRSFTNSTNAVNLKRNTITISDSSKVRIDIELPKSAPNSSSDLIHRNENCAHNSLPRQISMRIPGDLSRPASDSMLIKKRQNKSNTVTVLVIIGEFKHLFYQVAWR